VLNKDVVRKLKATQDLIPKVTSIAMQRAGTTARDAARKSAERRMDRPRPQTLKAIRNAWPNRDQVKAGKAVAKVFIMPFLVDELHPLVFGGTETETPKGGGVVVSPTREFRTNKHGNIPSLRRGRAFDRRRQQEGKFLEVPLRNKPDKVKHLPAGMYQIKGRGSSRRLVMIFSYREIRRTDPDWSEYPRVTREAWAEHFPVEFGDALASEIRKLVR
jgi:hypothetical protein